MSAAVKQEATAEAAPAADAPGLDAYALSDQVFALIDQHGTPPYPSTYSVWYAYASKSNDELVAAIEDMLARGAKFSTYEMNELCKQYLSEGETQAAQQAIGRQFETQMASVLEMISKSVTDSDRFQETLGQIEEGLPETVSHESIDKIISKLMVENRRMAEHSVELKSGLKESQTQIAQLNQELEEVRSESMKDPLTDVANRRAFDARLLSEVEACTSSSDKLCLALADLDNFKTVNDTFGHRIGDEVLKIFADIITENIKGGDMVARYGGEEFAIILPHTDIHGARKLLDRVRVQFSKTSFVIRQSGKNIGQITASFGIAAYEPELDTKSFVELADRKLYKAKHDGRNRIQI